MEKLYYTVFRLENCIGIKYRMGVVRVGIGRKIYFLKD